MLERCTNPNARQWPWYGGRGIEVCERWLESFAAFADDMGARPPGTSLDRFPDPNGNYEPGNCRWATQREQVANSKVRKLCEVSIALIRHMRRRRSRVVDLAYAFGVTTTQIARVVKGEGHAFS